MPQTKKMPSPFLVVRFVDNDPVWERFDAVNGQYAVRPIQDSTRDGLPLAVASRSLPILAVLPDRLFFFVQPDIDADQLSRRQLAAAVRLQMEQMFPPAADMPASVLTRGRQVLGCHPHPDLAVFVQRHQDILKRANAVTTAFFLAWNASQMTEKKAWIWENTAEGMAAIRHEHGLEYFRGDAREVRQRMKTSPAVDQNQQHDPHRWQWPELLALAPQMGWSRLRLPLPALEGESADQRRWGRYIAAVLVLGLLFSLGQYLRLSMHRQQAMAWDRATTELYSRVLSTPLGDDPHGRLLFRLNQLRDPVQQGPDPMAMLGLLSSAAPPDFKVDSFSLGPDSGTVNAVLRDYDQLEALLQALEGQEQMRFTLDQATSMDDNVQVTLSVSY